MEMEYAIGIDVNGKEYKFYQYNDDSIYCFDKNLISLDLSNCTNVKKLYCKQNQLQILDISKNIKLENLFCQYNKIKSLDVSNCENLIDLRHDDIVCCHNVNSKTHTMIFL